MKISFGSDINQSLINKSIICINNSNNNNGKKRIIPILIDKPKSLVEDKNYNKMNINKVMNSNYENNLKNINRNIIEMIFLDNFT